MKEQLTTTIQKDYFSWIKDGDNDCGNKETLNEAAWQIDVYLNTRPLTGNSIKDQINNLMTFAGDHVSDAPYYYKSLIQTILKILLNSEISDCIKKQGLSLDKDDINRLMLLQDFFEVLNTNKKIRAEILLTEFLHNPDKFTAEDLIFEYSQRTKVCKMGISE